MKLLTQTGSIASERRERMKQARIPDCFEMARGEIEVRVRGGEPGA